MLSRFVIFYVLTKEKIFKKLVTEINELKEIFKDKTNVR